MADSTDRSITQPPSEMSAADSTTAAIDPPTATATEPLSADRASTWRGDVTAAESISGTWAPGATGRVAEDPTDLPTEMPHTMRVGPETPPFASADTVESGAVLRGGRPTSNPAQRTTAVMDVPPTTPRFSHSGLPAIPGFEILAEVGKGGMGVVYQARQLDLNRLVAIKMVLADRINRAEDLVRFRLEAEMVARVHHPNVVQVYDSGAWNGHPYLVLEWVEGGNLGEYLRDRVQPPDAAARTVELLARAMHAAHCNGVVHRDLKPSNVLVARRAEATTRTARRSGHPGTSSNRADALSVTLMVDERPVSLTPKIADFGLAKQMVGATQLTETGKIMGTPVYMAPEQAEGKSAMMGPGTDIYALGVMLYQMLTGRLPFRDSGSALLLRIIEETPTRPRAFEPRVPRDLETICLKCLEKQPHRRYLTAEALADDLRRWQNGEPITARPTSTLERAWKWAARRPGMSSALAAAVVFLVVGFAGVTWQWRQKTEQWQRAEELNLSLKAAKTETDAVNRIFLAMFEGATPEKALGRKITAREVLQNAAARVDKAFDGAPQIESGVRLALGNSFRKIGEFNKADRQLKAALDLRRGTFGPVHHDTLVAATDYGRLLADKEDWPAAIPLLRHVVADANEQFGTDDPLTIDATDQLALVLQQEGDLAAAEPLFRDALAASRRAFDAGDPRTLAVVNDYGFFLRAAKRLSEAEAAFREAADGRAAALAPAHPATLESLSNLAVVLNDEGRWPDARAILEKVLADKKKVLGPDHIDTLSAMNNLAQMVAAHDPAKGLETTEEAYERYRAVLGPENPLTLTVENNVGQLAFEVGKRFKDRKRIERAATVLSAVLAVRRRTLPADHVELLRTAANLASVLVYMGKLDDAEPLLKESVAGRGKVLGPGDPETLETVTAYVQLLTARRKRAEAVAECQQSLAAADKAGRGEHPAAFTLLCLLVELQKGQTDRLAEIVLLAEKAVVLAGKLFSDKSHEMVRARRNLGGLLMAMERPAEAEGHLHSVYDITKSELGDRASQTIYEGSQLGTCLLALKRFDEAEPLLRDYYDALGQAQKLDPAQRQALLRSTAEKLVKLYEGAGKADKAAEWRDKLR